MPAPSFDVRHVDCGSEEVPGAIKYNLVFDVWPTPAQLNFIAGLTDYENAT
jgi:hypothetical protein